MLQHLLLNLIDLYVIGLPPASSRKSGPASEFERVDY